MAASTIPTSVIEEVTSLDNDNDNLKGFHKVTVILSSRSPSAISERRLVLTRNFPRIPIGRSSKVQSKGFIPANDNAWYDNPVMSRVHAEIFAEFSGTDPVIVFLNDLESFHGTFHTPNDGQRLEQQLDPHKPVKLSNGDIIRFGIEVCRNQNTFPSCSVDFLMEEMAQRLKSHYHITERWKLTSGSADVARRVFSVPDDMDVDIDEHEEQYRNFVADASKPAPTNILVSGLCHKKSELPVFDLTGDDDDRQTTNAKFPSDSTVNHSKSSVTIDLTSEPDYESDGVETGPGHPGASCSPPPPRTAIWPRALSDGRDARLVSSSSKVVLLDGEGLFSDDDDDDDDPEFAGSEDLTCGLREVDEEFPDDDSDASQFYQETDLEEGYTAPFYDDSSDEGSSIHYEDDFEIDDAATELSSSQTHAETPVDLSTITRQPTYTDAAPTEAPRAEITHAENTRISAAPHDLVLMSPIKSTTNSAHKREPSPSDAALFKRRPHFDNILNENRARLMGLKTGKLEYFAAREKNRAAVNEHNEGVPTSAIRETLVGDKVQTDDNADTEMSVATPHPLLSSSPSLSFPDSTTAKYETEEKVPGCELGMADVDASSIKLGDTDTDQFSVWSQSGDRFINCPRAEDLLGSTLSSSLTRLEDIRTATDNALDMASAFKFRQSKLAKAAQYASTTRGLPIKDLLGSDYPASIASRPAEAAEHSTLTNLDEPSKRSWGEAFNQEDDISDDILRAFPQAPETLEHCQGSQEVSRTHAAGITDVQATEGMGAEDGTVFPAQSESSRPLKRLRVATQVAACVALGSAMTFSYLVVSAPVF